MLSFEKKTALITGASYGIGEAFAKALASKGANVILVARSGDRLKKLASELTRQFKIDAQVVIADLSDPKASQKVFSAVAKRGQSVNILINNAGVGTRGRFYSLPADKEHSEIMVNVAAVVSLTHLFLPSMVRKQDGIIINVASGAAFQPVPFMAVYGATKAFVLSFSEALWAEHRREGIRVLALCPGETETNFEKAMGNTRGIFGRRRSVESVVKTAFRSLERGKSYAVDGAMNYFLANSVRFTPRSVVAKMAARIMGPKKPRKK
jgi:hypothetical protein